MVENETASKADAQSRWTVGEIAVTVGFVALAIILLPLALALKGLEAVCDFLRRRFPE